MLKLIIIETLTNKYEFPVIKDTECDCADKVNGDWVIINPKFNCVHLGHFRTEAKAKSYAKAKGQTTRSNRNANQRN